MEEPTVWQWEVTPKLEGKQYLQLTLDAFITLDGKDVGTRTMRTLQKEIEIEVGWPQKCR